MDPSPAPAAASSHARGKTLGSSEPGQAIPSEPVKPLLVGLSGPSSSGKTTLARLLLRILPNARILHQDDFYFQDSQIPYRSVPKRDPATGTISKSLSGKAETHEIQDWDCVEALNVTALRDALLHVRDNGSLPQLHSIQGQQSVGPGGEIDSATVEHLREKLLSASPSLQTRPIILVDGFMLFANSTKNLILLFDIKLLLRTTYLEAKKRREARTGYVTLEGFWKDPPFYVEDIVWPNYVKEHAYLFKNGDVDGEIDEAVCKELDVDGMPKECEGDVIQLVRWATAKVAERIESTQND